MVEGHKVNIYKPAEYIPLANYQKKKKIKKKTVPLTIASKRVKYLGINLTKDVKNPYTENYKILKRNRRKHK